ncbi:MAG: exodeoxyribonuclease VII small subunit [Magnetococcales bacterium]|nr:exodeoxyribonuclease VII small subunit [Magnetococcales bacterium]MBF0263066.1 exodeoxyribonuclease VII small subunit [Magnetococcales bacterium]
MDATATSLDFEGALIRLEEVVARLEKGDLPLEESLAAFEEGMNLSRHCQHRLDAAEQRIEELVAAHAKE